MEKIIRALLFLIIAPAAMLWSGYVLMILWGWFITPTFLLPVPRLPYMIGISLVVTYLTHPKPEIDNRGRDPNEVLVDRLLWFILKPLMCLGTGWVVTLFI